MIVAALSLANLSLPPGKYRVDRHSRKFETPAKACKEDRLRSDRLRREAAKHGGEWGVRALRLADKLDPRLSSTIPRTLASARYMRRLRILVIGHLWRLVDRDQSGSIRRFDIVKPSWQVNIVDLDDETAVFCECVDTEIVVDSLNELLDRIDPPARLELI